MPRASELKKGAIVRHKGRVCVVRKLDIRTPSSRGSNTLYKMKLQDVQSKQNLDETFKGEDLFDDVDFVRRNASYSYFDGELYVFMDDEDFTQYSFNETDLEGQIGFLSEGLSDILVMLIDGTEAGIQLPASVDLEIAETAPALKGGSVTKRTKPATLVGGLEVQIPEYLAQGEIVKVNTESGEYVSRVGLNSPPNSPFIWAWFRGLPFPHSARSSFWLGVGDAEHAVFHLSTRQKSSGKRQLTTVPPGWSNTCLVEPL